MHVRVTLQTLELKKVISFGDVADTQKHAHAHTRARARTQPAASNRSLAVFF